MNNLPDDVETRFSYGSYREPLTSDSAGWQSLHVRINERGTYEDPLEIPALGDPAICLILNRNFQMDLFSEGRWRGTKYPRGTGVLTPAGQPRLLRLQFKGQRTFAVLRLVLPQKTVDFVAQEVSKPGSTLRIAVGDIPFLDDPAISSFGSSVIGALRGGAPDFYAQAAAQWLAAHLLLGPSRGFEWRESLARERISDSRVIRVLEYIDAHFSDRLDLRVLSKEAGVSPFHFAAVFRKAVGATPHRHVQHLRMEAARSMLRDTDKSTLEIALTCGFGSASHFASAFRRQFLQSPTEYRSSQQQSHDKFGGL
jgi:AraC family transcriptional regulator